MFEALDLSCVRDERTLFSGLSFTIEPGEMVQIEGRNGAGKTSLLRILAGLSSPDAGEVRWQGVSTRRQRDIFHQQLLYLGHQPGVKSVLTAFENLAFYLSVNGPMVRGNASAEAIYQALENVGLLGYEDVTVGQMSAGQQRRVALARLWLSDAPLWILDEPLTAIDKQGVATLIALFEQHAQRGGMVLLTTHQDLQGVNRDVRKLRLTSAEPV
ncbi:cytochrome c biogenesis heme-transporting ATPase CcmA [Rahnella aceris]|jgi:heme exporter protein A|uniref:Cytochrome c biogenesis heme-transporting ATPase CcmA n=1 Tax=Rahnella sp. (strain Y9602) TaxID=2703885 RepID=A0ABW6CA44_RAHSY|nr:MULTISPECIES: cytochrome c biogenesis heme-transporting ATPase CcmA [Rahnella]AYA06152.1 cytochrome c biogenesis heme-transporting ATPase CcmA [Rahnella aquatilis]AZP50202.1 cytochrome c biogenesis heme-transporting ATPase CcmA [Rahnella aquatilis]MBU9867398.1 cytochrome c biogenesis heme-transporting ATPase CcmA [Rahnella aceris]MCM2443822.1 cytochrome c biogenesis heme-transporting ATPase CcmA [Rahnella sp. CG8]MDP9704662.1 heme exporter protein A [Rahnella aquatilis]